MQIWVYCTTLESSALVKGLLSLGCIAQHSTYQHANSAESRIHVQ